MEISDEEIVLKAWEVQVRRGWDFVIDTLLRGGVVIFPPESSEDQAFCGNLRGSTQQGTSFGSVPGKNFDIFDLLTFKADPDIPLPSQESEDEADEEEEEEQEEETADLSSNDCRGQTMARSLWSEQDLSQAQSICHRSLPVFSESTLHLKIQRFISEATRAYYDCFYSNTDIPADNLALGVSATSAIELMYGPMDASTGRSLVCSPEAASIHGPVFDRSPNSLAKLSIAPPLLARSVAAQVALVPTMPVLPSVAVERPIMHLPDGFILCLPLAARVPEHLRLTVAALQYFDMFALLPCSGRKRRKKPSRKSIAVWQRGFAIMAAILLEDAPDKMKGIFDYGETIRKAQEDGPDGGWLLYDEKFRKLKAAQPDVSWSMIHSGLWSELCEFVFTPAQSYTPTVATAQSSTPTVAPAQSSTPAVAPTQFYKPAVAPAQPYKPAVDPAHPCKPLVAPEQPCKLAVPPPLLRKRAVPPLLPRKLAVPPAQPCKLAVAPENTTILKNICFAYNRDICLFGPECFFKHICSNCGAEHSRMVCSTMTHEEPVPKRSR
ncbi:uncharacterized protein LOC144768702 [Lissotriton helveticus]